MSSFDPILVNCRLLLQDQVRKMVVACGGCFCDDLNVELTTHVIATAVGSLKYRVRLASLTLLHLIAILMKTL